jgi:hypothetical protein
MLQASPWFPAILLLAEEMMVSAGLPLLCLHPECLSIALTTRQPVVRDCWSNSEITSAPSPMAGVCALLGLRNSCLRVDYLDRRELNSLPPTRSIALGSHC